MKNRAFLVVLLGVLATLVLAACGGEQAEEQTPTPTATVAQTGSTEPTPQATEGPAQTPATGATEVAPTERPASTATSTWQPSSTVDFIVPFSAGGGYDAWARLLAPCMSDHLGGVDIVVRNVEGGGGLTGSNTLYQAEPDGTTIGMIAPAGLAGAQIGGSAQFDITDFSYIARVTTDSRPLIVNGQSDIDNVEELRAKAQQAPITQAMTGFATGDGVATIIVYHELGIPFEPVGHEGQAEARLSVIRGDTDALISAVESTAELISSGELKPILLIGEKPAEGEPGYEEVKDVPTIADLGLPELGSGVLDTQYFMAGPPGMPQEIRDAYEAAVLACLDDQSIVQQARESGRTPRPLNAEDAAKLAEETVNTYEKYREVLEARIKQQ